VNICCVYVDGISLEVKPEMDDIIECPHDGMSTSGMFAVSVYCICLDVSVIL